MLLRALILLFLHASNRPGGFAQELYKSHVADIGASGGEAPRSGAAVARPSRKKTPLATSAAAS
eukprot:9734080-Alexandrium_andersonii.AAC.1